MARRNKKGLTIGIYDDMFFSLQERLLREGHTLIVYADFNVPIPEDAFNVTSYKTKGKLKQVLSFCELMETPCDFYICGTGHSEFPFATLQSLGKPVLGYSEAATQLEANREFAHAMSRQLGVDKFIKLPEQHAFSTIDSFTEFMESTDKSWVVKQTASSPQDNNVNRTVVAHNPMIPQVLKMLKFPNAWFNPDGTGGALVEEFAEGHEVCFGAWFDGTHFITPMYYCIEHKGAQDGDRGLVFTGEVGTTLKWNPAPQDTRMWNAFKCLEPFLKGKCCGMVDINTIINPKTGAQTLIEYTIRFGRPTLELMLATMRDNENVGEALHSLALGTTDSWGKWHQLFDTKNHAIGITVFSYGYPLLPKIAEAEYDKHSIPFTVCPYVSMLGAVGSKMIQLFMKYNHYEKCWMANYNERQFVVVGLDPNINSAIQRAYDPLKNYNILGQTWRGDVGHALHKVAALTLKYNIA